MNPDSKYEVEESEEDEVFDEEESDNETHNSAPFTSNDAYMRLPNRLGEVYSNSSAKTLEEDDMDPPVLERQASDVSWYSPAKRRQGLGATRRNTLIRRTIDLGNANLALFEEAPTHSRKASRRASKAEGANLPSADVGVPPTNGKGESESDEDSFSSGSNGSSSDSSSVGDSSSDSDDSDEYDDDITASPTQRSNSSAVKSASSLNKMNLSTASFFDQLFAVMERSTRQLWRRKLDLILEIAVPLLFMAVSIALWAIWGNEFNKESTFVNYSNLYDEANGIGAAGLRPPVVYDMTCITQPEGTAAFPFFVQCGLALSNVLCDGDPSFLPFPAGTMMCRLYYSEIPNWQSIITIALSYFWRQLVAVPTLDSLISLQWTVLTSYKEIIPYISATMGGLAANTRYSAVLCSGNLYFVGPSAITKELINYMNSTSVLFTYVTDFKVYSSVAAARQASAAKIKDRLWAIVELKQVNEQGLDVVLHMNNSALPSFGTTYDDAYSGGVLFDTAELYVLSGFSTLQQLVSEFYLNRFHSAGMNMTQMIVATGTPSFDRVPLLINARDVLPLIYALAFLYSVSQQVKRIVLEKELRIREAMLIMGLRQWTLYVSEFLIQVCIFVFTCVLCAIMLKVTYVTKSDPLILFLVFILFALTTIPLSGIIASFFSKSRLALLVSPVVYFILVIPTFAMSNAKGSVITGFSIFSPSGFAAAINVFLKHETGEGCGTAQMTSSHDNPTMAVILGMLTADFFIYYLLMFYLDAVMPKEWGTPKHPLFFILDPIRWYKGDRVERLQGGPDGRDEKGVYETTDYSNDVVSFDGIRKEYKRHKQKFVAVSNLYWGMQENEISVLLGHNGAGKTTLLNMMTGMIEPDEGDCYIYGYSVRTEKAAVRQLLGFCPQHNILWSELTCRDHLEFYAKIKGLKGWELEDALCGMLFETDLLDKMDQPAHALSGGMKRRLSIAIAFVGMGSLVFLDEPTAGLDVGARRHVWDLLKRMSEARTILLTTHYMDEADLLGSRIGIMSQGRLKCTGSSLFLKSRLGVGYNIVIAVDPELDVSAVDEVVLSTVDGATVLGHNGCELSYQLPARSANQFPALLNEIDSVEADGIRGYSLAATTLEEVFLKVSEEDLACRGADAEEGNIELIWTTEVRSSVLWLQFETMMAKRFYYAMRDQRMQCFQIVCPVVCILIAMLLSLVQYRAPQTLTYDYNMFKNQPESVLDTSFCYEMWGTTPYAEGFTVNETYFRGAVDLSNMLLDTWFVHEKPRYGAVACLDPNMTATLARLNQWRGNNVNVFLYNSSSHHQVGLMLASYYDMFLKYFKSSSSYFLKYSTVLFNKPTATSQLSFIFIGALIMIPFTFLPSNPVAWIVKERQCGSRHLQNLCGVNFFVYWAANFLFDMVAYFIVMLLCIIIFAIFQRTEFTAPSRAGGTFVLFIVYGFTSTAFGYCLSFLFKESASAQTVVMGVSFVAGFLLVMIVYVLSLDAENLDVADKMRWGFRVVPSYCIGEGLINLLTLSSKIKLGTATGVWDMDQLGWSLVYMAAEFPVFCIITLLVDHPAVNRLLQRFKYRRNAEPVIPSDEDSDVEDEREAVYEAESEAEDATDVVRVVNLQKTYSNGNMAVKGISFSIFPGEVFAFLGTNGAGKTTTISMLCQQFLPTGGKAYVCGYDVVEQSKEALQCIGYCPQFDATLDLLTVEEQLEMYAGIRGIPRAQWGPLVDALCTLCELTMYRKTVTGALSGGNRRKLSVAMSLVGGPRVLFLDEPSAGMDPVARRGMWTAIQRAAQYCSVVLTTHHLEEVEALADIVAIMVRGYVRCIGDKVHLKNKFGSAFEISISLSSGRYAGDFVDFMNAEFAGAIKNEGSSRRFVYQLPRDRSFGEIFRIFQRNKKKLHITDYSVSQTSIEQIFLTVRREAMHLK